MPVNDCVYVVKQTGTHHVDLAGAPFFCGGSKKLNGAGRFGSIQPLFDGNCRAYRAGPK